MGYWKTLVVEAPDADRALELASATVRDGMVIESNHRHCDLDGLKPALASALRALGPGEERLVVVGSLIYYGR